MFGQMSVKHIRVRMGHCVYYNGSWLDCNHL